MTAPKYDFQKMAKGLPFEKNTKAAREWFRDQALGKKTMSVKTFNQGNERPFQKVENLSLNSIGRMYSFTYDPKHKLTLPYYDTFPLIFPFDFQKDRMLGINMHYLPPGMRARLMDALYTTLNNEKYNATTRLNITYGILKGAAQFKYFRPCIHCYLFSHVQGNFTSINPKEWDYVLLLPLQKFQKKSADFVWLESQLKVK